VQYLLFTVLVSDNCSTDDTRAVVAGFSDPRLRYVRAPSRLSMAHHWEFALSHIHDGWVTVIGDDDAILPHALSVVNRIVADTGVEAVRSHSAEYRWPKPERQLYGNLLVPLKAGVAIRAASQALEAAIAGITS
jgi:glycosyltransferase involved in cell wall biosynthesis